MRERQEHLTKSVDKVKSRSRLIINRFNNLSGRAPVSTFAAMFFQHAHVGHDHAPVDGLAHVVNRQQANPQLAIEGTAYIEVES